MTDEMEQVKEDRRQGTTVYLPSVAKNVNRRYPSGNSRMGTIAAKQFPYRKEITYERQE